MQASELVDEKAVSKVSYSVLLDSAAVHTEYDIRRFGNLQIMCDNHYTAILFMCQSGKQLNNLCAVFRIQISRRLICENDLRMNG